MRDHRKYIYSSRAQTIARTAPGISHENTATPVFSELNIIPEKTRTSVYTGELGEMFYSPS